MGNKIIMCKHFLIMSALTFAGVSLTSCHDNDVIDNGGGTGNNELADEWYAGGKLGTTFNATASAYEDPTPAIEEAGLEHQFKMG